MIPGTHCHAARRHQRCPICTANKYWASQRTLQQTLWSQSWWDRAQEPWPLTAPATTASPAATTTTMTTGLSMECALAVLSTRFGQHDKERTTERCHIKELSQQLNETSDQLAYIRKVLDSLVSGQTPAAVTAASSTASSPAPSSGSGCLPLGQATSLSQPSTASGSVNPSISGNDISGHATSASPTSFLQASQDLQDHAQTLAFQGHAYDTPMTHSPQPFIPSDLLPWFSLGMGTLALGQSQSFHQHQQPQQLLLLGSPGLPSTAPWTPPFTIELG